MSGLCDFENNDLCNWMNVEENDFDWILNTGSTPTLSTGPIYDHTLISVKGHYIFIEASPPAKEGWKAQLISEPLDEQDTGCVSFWYYMWGTVRNPKEALICFKNDDSTV